MGKWTRRAFLIGGGTAAAGLVVGVGYLATVDTRGLAGEIAPDGTIALNAWIHLRGDGKIVLAVPRTEMGQGVHTSLPMLIAEELELPLDHNVVVEHPIENLSVYTNFVVALNKRNEDMSGPLDWLGKRIYALFPYIGTGGSTSVVGAYEPLRLAGAAARSMLLQAAAESWQVDRAECSAAEGKIWHKASGRSLAYKELAARAASKTPDADLALKSPEAFRLIGKPVPRLDIPAKTRGEAKFGIDTPADLVATAVNAPVFGATVQSFDDSAARQMKGVVKTVDLGNAVAVVAETMWHAKQAAAALKIAWAENGNGNLSSAAAIAEMRAALGRPPGHVFRNEGDVDGALEGGKVVEAVYETPYLAHACMEPMNCTARVGPDGTVEMWASSQSPLTMKWGAEKAVGAKKVVTHTTLTGGGFGRRAEMDLARQAALCAAAAPGKAVKLIWSREEDIQHDMYRPAAVARLRAVLGGDGRPVALDFQSATQSVAKGFSRRSLPIEQGGDKDPANAEGATELPYAIPNVRIASTHVETPIPVGFWRSVGHSNNAFLVESFIDELAAAAKADPLDYRIALLERHPRLAPLARKLKEVSGWGKPLPAGRFRGVAVHESFRSFVGQVAEVSVGAQGVVKVHKVICVVDCGQVINPEIVRQQMEGGIIFALSALAYGEIVIERGRVQQSNFHDYQMTLLAQAPEIEVFIMPSLAMPGGVGEPGTPPLFAAVTNGIFAATGQRLRALPLTRHSLTLV